jgi:predicted phage baseplate assembly protein
MTLYAQVAPLQPQEASHPQVVEQPAQVVWEYFNGWGWQPLGVRDQTQTFVHRGLLQFIGPADMQARSDFGQPDLYWLRARWVDGEFKTPPRLQRLLTNTIWGSQTQTLKNEILGSSDGNPNQTFHTTLSPVLRGQQLEVLENQLPSPQEQATLKRRLGTDAITQEYDETGQPTAVWVRWLQVPDFHGSGPRDRHYILDHLTGVVQFGNGQQGLIPPLGRNTIRLWQYRTGGGEQGDRAANTITQLKTTVPFIDSVTNLEPAGGGAAQESIAQAQVRGPKQIRHRDRAVTAQDFEDLAFEASPDVARACAVVPQFNPLEVAVPSAETSPTSQAEAQEDRENRETPAPLPASQVKVLIVPSGTELQPVPSLGLMAQVERYLQQRCLPTLDVAVVGPEWVAVSVTAEVVPKTFETSDATRTAIMGQLDQFLHCLTGGRDGRGWGFGRRPHASDFYALIEAVEGVAWVPSLSFEVNPDPDEVETPFLIFPGQHAIHLVSPQGGR